MATFSLRDIDQVKERADVMKQRETIIGRSANGLAFWWKYAMTPGFGLFSEFYLMLLFNQLSTPFKQYEPWTTCYDENRNTQIKIASLAGLPVGMIVFGFLADVLGRKWGSVCTISCTLLGAIFLTAASPAPFANGDYAACNQFFWWIWGSYFLFGVGVGGEYPLSASISSENSVKNNMNKRGRDVLLTFTSKGLGTNTGNMVFFFLTLAAANKGVIGTPENVIFNYRLAIGLSIALLAGILPYRVMAEESPQFREMQAQQKKHKLKKPGYLILFRYYGLRLFGTCMSWFLWDILQYGNSLFSKQITGSFDHTLTEVETAGYTWLYEACSLVGYFVAAFTVDRKWMGRRRMQLMGFSIVGILFLLFGGIVPIMQRKNQSGAFVFLYCLVKFFSNFGADGTTFLIPSEVFATPVRARAHGMSAFSGKIGAIVGTYGVGELLPYGLPVVFYFLGAVAIGGAIFTFFLIPESSEIVIEAEDKDFLEGWLGREEAQKWFASKRDLDALEESVPEIKQLSLADTLPEIEVSTRATEETKR